MEQVLAVFAVLGLFIGLMWWLRRSGPARLRLARPRSARRLQLRERLSLAPQHSLCLVQIGGRTLLVGLSPAGCALLDSWRDQAASTQELA
jgi:flagellar biosynthetic protein FliO